MNLLLSVSVVFPLCIYILIGVLGARLKLLDQKLASSMNAFVFKLLFPLMMFENVIKARDALMNGAGRAVLFIFSVFAVSFTLLRLLVPLFIKDKPRQASFIQGSFRANTILFAVPVISALCGEDETGLAAMCVAATVPFCNAACVVLLETSRGGRAGFGKLLLSVLKNPLVIGAIAGCLFLLTGWHLPSLLSVPLKAVTGIITPLSLMLLGAGLRFRGILQDAGQLLIVCFIKLVLTPALSLGSASAGFRRCAAHHRLRALLRAYRRLLLYHGGAVGCRRPLRRGGGGIHHHALHVHRLRLGAAAVVHGAGWLKHLGKQHCREWYRPFPAVLCIL